jgi:hypothetical protein
MTNPLDENVERIMGALVRMPPKPHDQMKLGRFKKTTTSGSGRSKKKEEKSK